MPFHPSTIQRFKSQHLLLDELFKGRDRQWNVAAEGGKWSMQEQLAHLGRYQEIFESRIQRILKEEGPDVGRYVSDTDNGFPAWLESSVPDILQRLYIRRDLLIRQLGVIRSAICFS